MAVSADFEHYGSHYNGAYPYGLYGENIAQIETEDNAHAERKYYKYIYAREYELIGIIFFFITAKMYNNLKKVICTKYR